MDIDSENSLKRKRGLEEVASSLRGFLTFLGVEECGDCDCQGLFKRQQKSSFLCKSERLPTILTAWPQRTVDIV